MMTACELFEGYRGLRNKADPTDSYFGMEAIAKDFVDFLNSDPELLANQEKLQALSSGLVPMMSLLGAADLEMYEVLSSQPQAADY